MLGAAPKSTHTRGYTATGKAQRRRKPISPCRSSSNIVQAAATSSYEIPRFDITSLRCRFVCGCAQHPENSLLSYFLSLTWLGNVVWPLTCLTSPSIHGASPCTCCGYAHVRISRPLHIAYTPCAAVHVRISFCVSLTELGFGRRLVYEHSRHPSLVLLRLCRDTVFCACCVIL